LPASSCTGSINEEDEGGTIRLVLDGNSSWTLTGDSHITSLSGDLHNIDANGYHLYVDGSMIV
jgi:hypothetical protein